MDHKTDQLLAVIRDTLPAVWWAVYSGCIDKGFTPEQAMQLVLTHTIHYKHIYGGDSTE